MLAAIISLIGLACTVFLTVCALKGSKSNDRALPKSCVAWTVVFALFQAFLAVWGGIGLIDLGEPLAVIFFIISHVILVGCAYASLHREAGVERILARQARLRESKKRVVRFFGRPNTCLVITLMLAGLFAMLGLVTDLLYLVRDPRA